MSGALRVKVSYGRVVSFLRLYLSAEWFGSCVVYAPSHVISELCY